MIKQEIKIYYIRTESYENFCVKKCDEIVNADIILFAPDIISEIDYNDELDRKSFIFKEMANLSAKFNCLVCAGVKTAILGRSYDSIVCAHKGEILGISDSVILGEKNLGAELNLYKSDFGLVAIACYKDADFFECLKLFKLYGADIVINIDLAFSKMKQLNLEYCNKREGLISVSLCKDAFYVSDNEKTKHESFGSVVVDINNEKHKIIADNKNIYKIIAEKM